MTAFLGTEADLIGANTFDEGIKGLYRTTETDGVFCYMFFKAVATKGIVRFA